MPQSWVLSLVDGGSDVAQKSEVGPKAAFQLLHQIPYSFLASVQVQHGHLFSLELVIGLDAVELAYLGALLHNDIQQRPRIAVRDKDSRYLPPRMPTWPHTPWGH